MKMAVRNNILTAFLHNIIVFTQNTQERFIRCKIINVFNTSSSKRYPTVKYAQLKLKRPN